jgi:hypothetical protein
MYKLFWITTLLIAVHFSAHSQNAIAKIKYEQAEEAFAKDDYAVTLVKLDEAQKLLGSFNPKILYLRLMAAKGIVASGKYNWDFLEAARKDADYYIKQYSEMQGIEEKFRQVYEFSETLEKLPKTKELFEQRQAEAAEEHKKSLGIARFMNYSIEGINMGMSVDELKSKKPEYFAGAARSTMIDYDWYLLHTIPVIIKVKNNRVFFIKKDLFNYIDEDAGFTKGTVFINNLKNELGFDFNPVVTTKERGGNKDLKSVTITTYQWQLNKGLATIEFTKYSFKKSNMSVGTLLLEEEAVVSSK